MTGRFVWISEELYEACRDAWQENQPDAGTCEWAGDVAGAYESASAHHQTSPGRVTMTFTTLKKAAE